MENKNTALRSVQLIIVSSILILLTSCVGETSDTQTKEPIQTSIPNSDNTVSDKEPIEIGTPFPRDNNDTTKEVDKDDNNDTTKEVDKDNNTKEPIETHVRFPWDRGILKVSTDKHRVEHTTGSDFFWMADTAWDLLIELNDEEIDTYLRNRKSLGFNVILIRPVEDQLWQRHTIKEHTIREYAFNKNETTQKRSFKLPNEACWNHVDAIIEKARKLGLYVGLLPSWNMTFTRTVPQGLVNVEDAQWYGKWIAQRYKDKKNIIWVIGGDSGPRNPAGADYTDDEPERKKIWTKKSNIWNALATEIHNVVKGKQLITFHPAGGMQTALELFPEAQWLDFSMGQTGHCVEGGAGTDYSQNLIKTAYDRRSKHLPIVDGEPKYEGIEKCFYLPDNDSRRGVRFKGEEIMETAYRQVFTGAFGYTYGNHAIWLFWEKEGDNNSSSVPIKPWQEALNDKGAKYMKYLVNLIKSRPGVRTPAQEVLGGSQGGTGSYTSSLATKGDGYAFIYQAKGKELTVNLSKISNNASGFTIWRYNPLTGESELLTLEGKDTVETPINDTQDMVYVFDDKSKGYGKPGVLVK